MPLTYLDLTNAVLRRIGEEVLTSANFSSAIGIHAQTRDAVNAAIRDIYRVYPEWGFLHQSRNFQTVVGQDEYSFPSDVRSIDWDTFYLQRDDTLTPPVAASWLPPMNYTPYAQYVRPEDQQRDSDTYAMPRYVIRTQSLTFGLTPPPDRVYTIKYEAWLVPDDLVNFDDTTLIPDQFKHVIIDGALWYAYTYRTDTENADRIKPKFEAGVKEMRRILINQPVGFYALRVPRAIMRGAAPAADPTQPIWG
jgi:hypothetical protein